MRLKDLLAYEKIVIQCHDNPDADALASGYGVYYYLKQMGKRDVRFVYSGRYPIQKSNLVLMIKELEIPIDYVTHLEKPDLLVMVDCQYGQGNVEKFEADEIIVIDHHQVSGELPPMHDVRSHLGACSTIIWDLLKKEGIPVHKNEGLSTALYYGLYTDTNSFTELSQNLDKELRDDAIYDASLVTRLRNANLSLTELSIAGEALLNYHYSKKHRLALVGAKPCDPNILGLISDLILEVDVVDVVCVYSVLPFGIKYSVRSCIKEVKANDLAAAIGNGLGSGGGHQVKAGGLIQRELFEPRFKAYMEAHGQKVDDFDQETPPYYMDWFNHFLCERLSELMDKLVEKTYQDRETVIFDLDGTLLNTLEDLYLSVNAALREFHMPERTLDEVRSFVGNGVQKLMERSVPDGKQNKEFDACFTFFKEHYALHCKDHTGPYEGIPELLEELKAQGKHIAVVSNKMDSAVKILRDELFMDTIEVAIGERQGIRKKPARDMVWIALKELGVDPEKAIYVGDSDVDIATAKNAGLPCVTVTWGFRDREFLLENGAKCLIDKPEELLQVLKAN